jgi:hypothetical protein
LSNLVKSKQRVADHGEVFTPEWMVKAMLDLVKDESERIDSRFLEPACGSGNFLVEVLKRKLAAVELKYGKSDFDRQHYALLAVMCIYGVELLPDNIAECRASLLKILGKYLNVGPKDDIYRAAYYVLSQNLVHGDAMAMLAHCDRPIVFPEWGYLGKGKFQRRDFNLASLTQSAAFRNDDSLFRETGAHDLFMPTGQIYSTESIKQLAEHTPSEI